MTATVEKFWLPLRARHGTPRGRRRPSAGIAAVLTALVAGPAHGREVARRAEQESGNVAAWLHRLQRLGLVTAGEPVAGLGHQGGGRPGRIWELTSAGRELAELIAQEAAQREQLRRDHREAS